MTSTEKRTPNALRSAARRYAAEHGVKYTEALRQVTAKPQQPGVHIRIDDGIDEVNYLIDTPTGLVGQQSKWDGTPSRLLGFTSRDNPDDTTLQLTYTRWAATGMDPRHVNDLWLVFADARDTAYVETSVVTDVDESDRPASGLPGSAEAAPERAGIVFTAIATDDSFREIETVWFYTADERDTVLSNMPAAGGAADESGLRYFAAPVDSSDRIYTQHPITASSVVECVDLPAGSDMLPREDSPEGVLRRVVRDVIPVWRSTLVDHKHSIAKGGPFNGIIPTWLERSVSAAHRHAAPRRLPETGTDGLARVYLVDMWWREPGLCGIIVLTPGCTIAEAMEAATAALPSGSGKDGSMWRLHIPHPRAQLKKHKLYRLPSHLRSRDRHYGCEQCVYLGLAKTPGDPDPTSAGITPVDAADLDEHFDPGEATGPLIPTPVDPNSDVYGIPFSRQLAWAPSGYWDALGVLRPVQTAAVADAHTLPKKWRIGEHSHAIRIAGESPYSHIGYW